MLHSDSVRILLPKSINRGQDAGTIDRGQDAGTINRGQDAGTIDRGQDARTTCTQWDGPVSRFIRKEIL